MVFAAAAPDPAFSFRVTSSVKESQASHSWQRPIHFSDSYAQFWQTYFVRVFAIIIFSN
jgi:hypothetical protein